jgi:hypothetical protein
MHLRKLVALLVIVGALVGVALWQRGEQQSLRDSAEAALLPGFDRQRLIAVRVDNLERSLQLRIERGASEWQIVDPIQFPAETAVVEALLDALSTQHAKPVPDADPTKLALDPPRAILDVEERVGEKLLKRRIEVGAVDLDDHWVFARVDGQVFRTERALDTVLERDLPDWRSRFLLRISARQVSEIRRSGTILFTPEGEATDLSFAAVNDGGWRATEPFEASLDSEILERVLLSACALRAFGFIDAPGPLAQYGLDPPRIRVELTELDGSRQAILLAPEPQGELWYAAREGSPHVFRVPPDAVMNLAPPVEGLVEREFARAARDSVTMLELVSGARTVKLTRSERGWSVSATEGELLLLAADTADSQRVGDALGLIERTRIEDFLFARALASSDIQGALRVHLPEGVQGGVLGQVVRRSDGAEGVEFRRDGDGLVSLLPLEILELTQRAPDAWRSLELHRVPEIEVARIELSMGPATRAYGREEKGKWVRIGSSLEAKEFAKQVDGLLSMRAERILPRGEEQLTSAVTVRLARYSGAVTEFTLGDCTLQDGQRASVYRTGERFAVVKGELLAALRALLQGE